MSDFLTELDERTAYSLATDADCMTPDTPDSVGAAFLTSVRDAVTERLRWKLGNDEAGNLAEAAQQMRDGSDVHELADDAPDVYTGTRWAEFVDLGGYQEDVTELGEVDGEDLTKSVAGVALYMIADRLINVLLTEAEEASDDDED